MHRGKEGQADAAAVITADLHPTAVTLNDTVTSVAVGCRNDNLATTFRGRRQPSKLSVVSKDNLQNSLIEFNFF